MNANACSEKVFQRLKQVGVLAGGAGESRSCLAAFTATSECLGCRGENRLGLLHGSKGKPHGKQPCRGCALLQPSFFVDAGWLALG